MINPAEHEQEAGDADQRKQQANAGDAHDIRSSEAGRCQQGHHRKDAQHRADHNVAQVGVFEFFFALVYHARHAVFCLKRLFIEEFVFLAP